MKNILIYLWQLPQNLLGVLLLVLFRTLDDECSEFTNNGALICFSDKMRGGVSLGRYVFLKPTVERDIHHELGHCRQSRMLGWLYLPIVGIPSIIHAAFYKYNPQDPNGYYRYWCEAWADRLGGVRREIKTGIK